MFRLKVNPISFNNLRQLLKRSNAEGVQLRNLCAETENANARIAPVVVRLQATEAQLSARVSAIRSQETELQTQLNDLMNQICSSSEF